MARVTVEDCIDKVDNRFDLVLIAAHRARLLYNGEKSELPTDNDKTPVLALREIAEESIPLDELRENVIKSFQLYPDKEDEPKPTELIDDIETESNINNVTVSEDESLNNLKSKEEDPPILDTSVSEEDIKNVKNSDDNNINTE